VVSRATECRINADCCSISSQHRTPGKRGRLARRPAAAYRTLAERNGWDTVAEFRGCESATQAATERRVLQQVLACIREQSPDAVYVHEQSRLTRGDELEVALLLRELRERRLKIIVNGVVRDLASIDERFMIGIQSLVDRAESERIKERLGRGKRERAHRGQKNSGPAPLGYENPPPGTRDRGKLRIVSEEAAVVRKLFALAASGKGDQAVAVALNDLGMKAPRGGRWGKSSVRRVLANPAYIGTAASGVWTTEPGKRSFRRDLKGDRAIIVKDAHEPIIDRALWDAVHNRARLPRTAVPRMLTGLLWVDGRPFHGDSCHEASFYRAERGLRGCAWLETKATDAAVWEAFASLATSPEFVLRIMTEAANPKEQAVIQQEVEYLEDQIAKARRRLANLVDLRADGDIDRDTFRAKSDEAKQTVDRCETEAAGLRSKLMTADSTVAERVVSAVRIVLGGQTRLTTSQKRSILGTIVRRVDVEAERTAVRQHRGQDGRLAGSGGLAWSIRKVSFRLALPPVQGATAGQLAEEGAGNEPALAAETDRCGQLATTYSDCGQEPGRFDDRGGQLVTTSWDCG
jgi:DNA invertase Pin-like site-specific DNA recombinase